MKNWNRLILKYFDFNHNNKIDWWEYVVPFILIFLFELMISMLANLITG